MWWRHSLQHSLEAVHDSDSARSPFCSVLWAEGPDSKGCSRSGSHTHMDAPRLGTLLQTCGPGKRMVLGWALAVPVASTACFTAAHSLIGVLELCSGKSHSLVGPTAEARTKHGVRQGICPSQVVQSLWVGSER